MGTLMQPRIQNLHVINPTLHPRKITNWWYYSEQEQKIIQSDKKAA